MKPLALTAALLAISCCGCTEYTEADYLAAARKLHPQAQVQAIPNEHAYFLAKYPDGRIWYFGVRTTIQGNGDARLGDLPFREHSTVEVFAAMPAPAAPEPVEK